MDVPTSAVIMMGLQTVGKPAVDTAHAFVMKVFGPPLDALGDVLASPIRSWQESRALRASEVVMCAAAMMTAHGIEPATVPARTLLPILEHGSLAEEPDLQLKWSSLLANAASPNSLVLPGFAEILRQLLPTQAHILNWMFAMEREEVEGWIKSWPDVDRAEIETTFGLPPESYALMITDLG